MREIERFSRESRCLTRGVLAIFAVLISTNAAEAAPSFQQAGNLLVMSNGNVQVQYDLDTGMADFYWQNTRVIFSFYSAVTNGNGGNPGCLSTGYASRSWGQAGANTLVVTNTGNTLPTMLQYFTLDQTDSFLVSVALTAATNLDSRWMAPLVVNATGGVDLGSYSDDRALFVPFDNDAFVSYNSEPINGSDTGSEVGAFYDNTTRIGLVVGSVTHDTWKTGVYWSGANNRLNSLTVYGGMTSHWTWDVAPHGLISGTTITSPVIFVGFGGDWRNTMERFASANTNTVPRRTWAGGVPFGWNSWGVTNYQSHINYTNSIAVSDSIHTNLQLHGFTNNGTVYVNLDSYWDNLWTDYNGTQVLGFVTHCHANGQKAGVYYTPFAFWGKLTDATNYLVPEGWPGNYYTNFYAILLKDANGNYIRYANGNAYAIDPTNPHTKGYIDYYTGWFRHWGFDYVKLDFLSLGALEGVHYDPRTTTGIQAFNEGMGHVLNDLGTNIFISESIAPIFPYQYAHSRRIACDAEASKISNTAYTMNSVSCGWWLDRLYAFNDPDLMVFDNGPDNNEIQSRLINCAITGVFLNGSILTNATSIALAQECLTNAAINAVARSGQTFRPVDGASSTGAANLLESQIGPAWYIAVFNYTGSAAVQTVDLNNAGLPAGTYYATNLWDGSSSVVSGSFNVNLNEKQAKLFELVTAPGFTISALPATRAIGAVGDSTDYVISVASSGGFNGNVKLSLQGVPAGVTYGFSSAVITGGSGSATLYVTNSGDAPAASYVLSVTGASVSLTNTATVALLVGQTIAAWTGDAAPDGNWQNDANWGGALLQAGDWLSFGAGTQLLTTNNFSSGTVFGNLSFNSGAPAFVLNGNGLTLANAEQDNGGNIIGGAITDGSASNQTINLPVTISAGSHVVATATGTGHLNFSGPINRSPGATLQFNQNGGAINLGVTLVNGIIGGWSLYSTSSALINNNGGAGTVDWASISSGQVSAYSGYTVISGSGQTIANSAAANVKVTANGSTSDTVGAGTTTINTLNWVANNQNGYLDIPANATLRFGRQGGIIQNSNKYLRIGNGQAGSSVTAGGASNMAGELCIYNLSYYSGSAVEFWTTLTDNGGSGFPLTVTTFGSVNMDNANTYSGGTHINAGDFYCNNGGDTPLGSGPVYVYPGGRADLGGDNFATITNNFYIAGHGFLANNQPGAIKGTYNGTMGGLITLMGAAQIDPNAGTWPSTCTFSGGFAGLGNLTFGGPSNVVAGIATLAGSCHVSGDIILDATANANGGAGLFMASNSNNLLKNGGDLVLVGGTSGLASLDLNGTTQSINGLTATMGSVANAIITSSASTQAAMLVVGNDNEVSTFGGVMKDGRGNGILCLTKTGSGTQSLTGNNTYSGSTVIDGGVLALSGSGSISNSSLIMVAPGATLDASGRTDQTFTLNGGQTLQGDGTINASLTVAPTAALMPGGLSGLGRLTVNGVAQLQGTTVMRLNATTATNDQIDADTFHFGGILTVTNLAGMLAAGQSFQLFTANAYSGAFGMIILPALNNGLMWNNRLAIDGVLQVVSTVQSQPSITGIALAGTNLTLSGTNGPVGGQFVLLNSTNPALPLSHWVPVLTNSFDTNGNFNFTHPVNSEIPQNYFLLQLQ